MNDKAWKNYSATFRRKTLPEILSSRIFLSIQAEELDIQQATEIGVALLLAKPIIVIAPPGRQVPEGLRRAAVEILENFDIQNDRDQERLHAAFVRLGLDTKPE